MPRASSSDINGSFSSSSGDPTSRILRSAELTISAHDDFDIFHDLGALDEAKLTFRGRGSVLTLRESHVTDQEMYVLQYVRE